MYSTHQSQMQNAAGGEEESHMSPSPLCRECGFPLCYYRTKNCILYIGGLQAMCGNCGLAQEAKTLFDFSSPFMTELEQKMSQRLYTIANTHGTKCTYRTVKDLLSKEFGTSAWVRYKTTARQDLESLAELRRIKATQKLDVEENNPKLDRELLNQSFVNKSQFLQTSAEEVFNRSRKTKKMQTTDRVNARSLSSVGLTSLQVLKNEHGRVVYADLPSLVKMIAGQLSDDEREEVEGALLMTYREFTGATELLACIVSTLDVALDGECFLYQQNLPRFLDAALARIKLDVGPIVSQNIYDELETLLLEKYGVNDSLTQEQVLWTSLKEKMKYLIVGGPDTKNVPASGRKSSGEMRDVLPFIDRAEVDALSPPKIMEIMSAGSSDSAKQEQILHIASKDIAYQLTLITAACYKRIDPREMVAATRKKTAGYQDILNLYNRLTKWVQDEFLAEALVLVDRVNVFVKFVKIAHKCAELGNFFCCIALIGCFVKSLIPDDLWEMIPQSAKIHYQVLFDAFLRSGQGGREGYDAALKQFEKKFFMPDFRYFLQTLEMKIDRLPKTHKENGLINFSKFSAYYRLITQFFANQHLPAVSQHGAIVPDHKMQAKIAQSLARCGPVKSGADIWNMKKYSELKESVKTQVMYESLNKLGFG
eukprot:Stramenopile-MAST_4_protein_1619